MSVISDDSKLVLLALSWISPCSLETPEGIALYQKRKATQGDCKKAGCPFSWYCETVAGAVLTAATDLAELTMGLYVPAPKSTRNKAEGCRNLVLKAFKEMRNVG